jgi:hypothetical protein
MEIDNRSPPISNYKEGKKDKPGFYWKALFSHQARFSAVTCDKLSNQLTKALFFQQA